MVSLPNSRRQCTFKLERVLSAFPVERLPEMLPEELLREVFRKHKCLFGGVFHSAKEMHRSLPEQLELREVKYVISEPGRKQSPFVVVTNMLDRSGDEGVSAEDMAELYGFRWNVELDIRSIKTHLNMDFMRCKSPPMVHTEFWMKLLAYNLIRMTAGLAAKQESILPREISFVSTCQFILSNWDLACFSALNPDEFICRFLRCVSQCRVGSRPGRFEPRCVKRRRDQYQLMVEPRNQLRHRLSKGDNSFE